MVFVHPVLWLKERERFWPSAIGYGIEGLADISANRWVTLAFTALAMAGMGGAVVVLHPSALLVFVVAVVLVGFVIARGARLKWSAERASQQTVPPAGIIVQAGATYNEIHHHHAPRSPEAAPRIWLPAGVEIMTTEVEIRTEPPTHPEAK